VAAPAAIVVMGVSGCGKTTIASALARKLGRELAEADDFHSPANVEKMRSGVPLTDADREPWLEAIADWIDAARAAGRACIVACSALKRAYRARLARGHDDVRFVYLQGAFDTVSRRLAVRTGHYMPLALLQSQYDALEEPGGEENPIVVSVERPPDVIVEDVIATLARC
jgi:gluconokinase